MHMYDVYLGLHMICVIYRRRRRAILTYQLNSNRFRQRHTTYFFFVYTTISIFMLIMLRSLSVYQTVFTQIDQKFKRIAWRCKHMLNNAAESHARKWLTMAQLLWWLWLYLLKWTKEAKMVATGNLILICSCSHLLVISTTPSVS